MFTNIFSPLQRFKHPSRINVSIKRDDLIDPYISGNKWRKLKFILDDAERTGRKHLVTFGGAYSNHLVATAAAASHFGFKSTAFVRGEEVNNEMLLLCRLYGMRLIFTDRESYKHKELLFEEHFGADLNAYFINEGGAGLLGLQGCAEIIGELPDETTHIICAAGTGTTAAGLLKGILDKGLKTELHVVPVLKGGDFIRNEITGYGISDAQLALHTNYHFGGYAKTTPELIEFIKGFVAEEGILIDPVYTGKMFYALDDLINQNVFKTGDKIVALHTGGLLGLMGMKDKF